MYLATQQTYATPCFLGIPVTELTSSTHLSAVKEVDLYTCIGLPCWLGHAVCQMADIVSQKTRYFRVYLRI